MAKKPASGPSEESADATDGTDRNTTAASPPPEIQLTWAKIISNAAQDPDYAQRAFADLATAFAECGVAELADLDPEQDLVPALSDAQRMVSGALSLKAQEQAASGLPPQGYTQGYSWACFASAPPAPDAPPAETPDTDNSDQSNSEGGETVNMDTSATNAPMMGGCVGTFGTAGSLGTVGGTAGSAATVGSYGSAGMVDPERPAASLVTHPTMATSFSQASKPTVGTIRPTEACVMSQACAPTQPCVPTQPTQPTVATIKTQPTVASIKTQPTMASIKPTTGSILSQPAPVSSTRLSGASYADPMMGGCWGSAGTIGSAGTFGGCAGTVGTGGCYGCAGGDEAKLTPMDPCMASLMTQQTIASIKPTVLTQPPRLTQPATELTQATIKPTVASLKTVGSVLSQPAPLSADPMAGGCNGTFGTVGCLGSVGGTAGSAGTVGTYGSAGIVNELQPLERSKIATLTPCVSPCQMTQQTTATIHGSFAKAPMADLRSTRLSGASMGSFATYCGCVADGAAAQDPMMGGCWGSAGTIGSAGSFGGCAGTVGTAACYGSAGDSVVMETATLRNPTLTPVMPKASLSTLRPRQMTPLRGEFEDYGSYWDFEGMAASYGCMASACAASMAQPLSGEFYDD
ncbi:thiocillin family RiPP [Shimia marina]|uniref:Uncharacterized protein n=1 Tax=Shimia marina TaxID=321267 RepID=A0A0N7LRG9_9RHOB|nr:thiocillin family RiPP [Shimia marina]CUH50788.1 hypothetical protein SHM7688_00217 [Shimia marina]SFE65955.1 hypothetical protein SAMN04488037_11425 [Shimia marina]